MVKTMVKLMLLLMLFVFSLQFCNSIIPLSIGLPGRGRYGRLRGGRGTLIQPIIIRRTIIMAVNSSTTSTTSSSSSSSTTPSTTTSMFGMRGEPLTQSPTNPNNNLRRRG